MSGCAFTRRAGSGGGGGGEKPAAVAPSSPAAPRSLEERVVELREQRPDWGARKLDGRALVYYCRSLVRDLDLLTQRSTALDRWVS